MLLWASVYKFLSEQDCLFLDICKWEPEGVFLGQSPGDLCIMIKHIGLGSDISLTLLIPNHFSLALVSSSLKWGDKSTYL